MWPGLTYCVTRNESFIYDWVLISSVAFLDVVSGYGRDAKR